MFNLSDMIKDTVNDDVRPLLKLLNSRNGWNAEAKEHFVQLEKLLKRKSYKVFVGHPTRYHLSRIGQSCLYDVPMYRRGSLADFRGKRVRLVCMSSGRFSRLLMAGVVGVTPVSKLRIKNEISYVFPDIGDHEIVYLGRRYMLIKASGKFLMPRYESADMYIDPDSCDFILLDGKNCCPIATLELETDGRLTGKIIGFAGSEGYASIQEAIRSLVKQNQSYSRFVLR